MPSRRLYVEFLEARFLPSTYYLHQGDDLQKTINAAHPGDYLLLDPGAISRRAWGAAQPPHAQGSGARPPLTVEHASPKGAVSPGPEDVLLAGAVRSCRGPAAQRSHAEPRRAVRS